MSFPNLVLIDDLVKPDDIFWDSQICPHDSDISSLLVTLPILSAIVASAQHAYCLCGCMCVCVYQGLLLNPVINHALSTFLILSNINSDSCCVWLLLQPVPALLTDAPRARCQAARRTRLTLTLSLISVTPCHTSMPRSHATATPLRGSTGSCGTSQSGRRKRRRSGYWNAWRGKKKGARPATGGAWAAPATCAPPTLSVETWQQTPTPSSPTTNPGYFIFSTKLLFLDVLFQRVWSSGK